MFNGLKPPAVSALTMSWLQQWRWGSRWITLSISQSLMRQIKLPCWCERQIAECLLARSVSVTTPTCCCRGSTHTAPTIGATLLLSEDISRAARVAAEYRTGPDRLGSHTETLPAQASPHGQHCSITASTGRNSTTAAETDSGSAATLCQTQIKTDLQLDCVYWQQFSKVFPSSRSHICYTILCLTKCWTSPNSRLWTTHTSSHDTSPAAREPVYLSKAPHTPRLFYYHYFYVFISAFGFVDRTAEDMTGDRMRERGSEGTRAGSRTWIRCSEEKSRCAALPTELNSTALSQNF